MVSSTPRPHFTPGKDPVPILQEAGRSYVVYQIQSEFCVKLPSAELNDFLLALSSFAKQIQEVTSKLSIADKYYIGTVIRRPEGNE